jgi:predicted nucleic-acid-binding Zn-ribbon protein
VLRYPRHEAKEPTTTATGGTSHTTTTTTKSNKIFNVKENEFLESKCDARTYDPDTSVLATIIVAIPSMATMLILQYAIASIHYGEDLSLQKLATRSMIYTYTTFGVVCTVSKVVKSPSQQNDYT